MKNYQITGLMLFIGLWMFTLGAWGGTHLSKDDKYELHLQGYNEGYTDCQRGILTETVGIGMPKKPAPKNKIRNQSLKLKFRG